MAPRTQPHEVPGGAWGSRRIESRADTLVRPATQRPVDRSVVVREGGRPDKRAGNRFGFVMLFVLSFFLLYITTGLACGILCAGYGFFAAVVFLLGLGFLAGGIYFLGRATERQVKRLRDMTADERADASGCRGDY